MPQPAITTIPLGTLVVAAFDEAALHRTNEEHISSLANEILARILQAQPGFARRIRAKEGAMTTPLVGAGTRTAE